MEKCVINGSEWRSVSAMEVNGEVSEQWKVNGEVSQQWK